MNKWRPIVGEIYYAPSLMSWEVDCTMHEWAEHPKEQKWYKAGAVCRTEAEALELARKMLAVAKERVEND